MEKKKFRKWLYLSMLFCLTAITIFSCRKMDSLSVPIQDKEVAAKFLRLPPTASSQLRKVAKRLKTLNQRAGFLTTIALNDGYAVWDKAIIAKSNSVAKRNLAKTESANDTIILIPLVLDNDNRVNAFISARFNDSISLMLYRANEYESYGFGTLQDSTINAEKLAVQFMLLDFETFGYSDFDVIDDRLLKDGSIPIDIPTKDTRVHIEQNRGSAFEVWTYDICTSTTYLNCSSNANCCKTAGVPPGACNACANCWKTKQTCTKESVLVTVDDGWFPSGGNPNNNETGGGGNQTGTNTTVSTQCNPTPSLDNGLPPCPKSGSNGFLPVVEAGFPKNPCETVDSLMKMPRMQQMFPYLRDSTSGNYEIGIYIRNPFTTPPIVDKISGEPDSLSIKNVVPNVPVDGFAHIHYNDPKRLSVFSAADLNTFYDLFKNGKIANSKLFTFSLVTDSTAYILMISDTASFRKFGNTFLGEENKQLFERMMINYSVDVSKPASQNENGFLKMLKQLTSGGLTLFKGNGALTEFKQMEFDYATNEVKEKPCS